MIHKVRHIPNGHYTVTPYLVMKDAAEAIQFYKQAFGAIELSCLKTPDGRVMHAEVKIGDSPVMITEECPSSRGPLSLGGTPVSLYVYVAQVDSLFNCAIAAGATVIRPVEDQFYGDRCGSLSDPYGHIWHIATHREDVSPDELRKRAAALCTDKQPGPA